MTARRLGVAAALVDGERIPGDVLVADGRIAAVGAAPAGRGGLAAPGFVDLQVNGFAGVDFLAAEPPDYVRAGTALAATGVTTYLPTFITAPVDAMRTALRHLAAARTESAPPAPRIAGAHLEGPFLSPRWPGAHPPEHLRAPDPGLLAELLAAGPVAMVTIAPELPGALHVVRSLAARGVLVAIGHTDADAATARAAFAAGARSLTHVFNAHRRWQARDPGPAGAALVAREVTVSAIADGVHLAPETLQLVLRAAGERLCLITDATEAAGLAEGTYRLGGRTVTVAGDAPRLADGTLAGSVLTMDRAVRELVRLGASTEQAVHAATRRPAAALGAPELGRLAAGGAADVAVLDDDLTVVRTLVGGREAYARG